MVFVMGLPVPDEPQERISVNGNGEPIETRSRIRSRNTTFARGVMSRIERTLVVLFRLNLMGIALQKFEDPR
jgi:hypothetical protein